MSRFAWIDLRPPFEDCQRISRHGSVPPEKVHCTLVFLGADDRIGLEARERLRRSLRHLARQTLALPVVVGGLGIFKNPGREVIYARVEDPTFALAEFRERVAELCRAAGVPPSEEFAWVPHVTLAERRLGVVAAPSAEVSPPPARSVRFNALHVFLGGVTEVMMLQWPGEPTLTGA